MINIHKKAALLIDADNAQEYPEQILKISEYFGELTICRAYGDWKSGSLSSYQKKIESLPIERVQVDQVGKNASDHHLLVEIGEILAIEIPNEVRTFVIVSGDGGFTSACGLIQARGCEVIVIGSSNKTAKTLTSACNKYYVLEDLDKELRALKELYPISPNEVRSFFWPLLYSYYRFTHKEYIWISYSQLETELHRRIPDFESKFGKYAISQWLRNFDKDFECDEEKKMIRKIDSDLQLMRQQCLLGAYIETKGPDDLAPLDQLGKALRKDPNYEYRFGSKKLSKWLKEYPEFEIRGDHVIYKDPWLNSSN